MKKNLFFIIFFFFLLLFSFQTVFAADVFTSSDKTTVIENQTFTVTVNTNTKGVYINSIEGLISFPKDLLEVQSVSTAGSVFSIWVEQPNFSNLNGTVSFNGGVPTPGFSGARGKVLSILFKAKKVGTANASFSSASIYANDGIGTNITQNKTGISINIIPYKGAETEEEVMTSDKLPPSPIITSLEMPDSEVWYSINSATFAWELPAGVTTSQLLFGFNSDSIPTISYTPPIKEKKINDFSDGVRYFHVRFKNSAGWGKTAHRKIKIDNTAPKNIEVSSLMNENDLISLKMKGEDATSGISKYKILIDGNFVTEVVAENNKAELILPPTKKGNHEVNIIAYDRAGNLSEKNFVIEFPEFQAPKIIQYDELIIRGEKIKITGLSYPNTDIRIWLQNEKNNPKSYITKTLIDGSFTFESDFIEKTGLTSFWAEAMMSESVISPSSEKYFTTVNKPAFFRISIMTIRILAVTIPALILLIIIIYMIYHAYHKLKKMRRRLLTDLKETESEAHKIFRILKDDVKDSMAIFKNKEIKEKLSEEDKETIEALAKDVEEAEEYFAKRIKNIEEKDL